MPPIEKVDLVHTCITAVYRNITIHLLYTMLVYNMCTANVLIPYTPVYNCVNTVPPLKKCYLGQISHMGATGVKMLWQKPKSDVNTSGTCIIFPEGGNETAHVCLAIPI